MTVSKFEIVLDNSPAGGFYFAGDVVRGHVNITCTKDIKCRALRLRLIGTAKCHWHTGSGDDRIDFDGSHVRDTYARFTGVHFGVLTYILHSQDFQVVHRNLEGKMYESVIYSACTPKQVLLD